mmetsp:Transcript_38643/g.114812  ORF Transcript_38643/g.114812 Transcript_38643/m.114812 type:complete len:216 (-) Transcript_38643:461-1108(-)
MANVSFERDAAALKCLYCPRTTVSTCSALLRPALRPTLQFVLAAKPAAQLALPPCSQPCGLPCTSPLQPTLRPFGSRARPTVRLEACCSALPPPPYFFLYLFYLLPTYLPLLPDSSSKAGARSSLQCVTLSVVLVQRENPIVIIAAKRTLYCIPLCASASRKESKKTLLGEIAARLFSPETGRRRVGMPDRTLTNLSSTEQSRGCVRSPRPRAQP